MACTDTLLPPNATTAERALEQVTAERLCQLDAGAELIGTLWNPQTCPAALLPWLAWALSVDEWNSDWPEETKRAVCAESAELHRIKGTPAAVKKALQAMGYDSVEIIEGGGNTLNGEQLLDGSQTLSSPASSHQFDVILNTGSMINADTAAKIAGQIHYYKNARSHLNTVRAYGQFLDGSHTLDGSRNLNGGIIYETL